MRITRAIRTVDSNHIVYIEGNWYGTDFSFLTPHWDVNMVYSFHKYWSENTQASIQSYLDMRDQYNVPLWLGEFGENSNPFTQHTIPGVINCVDYDHGYAGIAYSDDNGINWTILRAFVKPGVESEPRVYAYPNPFSPLRHNQIGGDGFIRFQFKTNTPARAKIRVFDFAMDLVTTVDEGKTYPAGDWAIPWNGKTGDGKLLANGVYFYQLDLEGQGMYWGKIIIID